VRDAATPAPPTEAEAVAAFLARHPDFLAERPELYRLLAPPRRLHGETLADHMAAMLSAERGHQRAREAELQVALADGRAGSGLAQRVRLAVLALLRGGAVAETVAQEFPPLLRLETATLLAGAALPPGTLLRLLGRGRDVRMRSGAELTDAAALHAEAAPLITRDALVLVPLVGAPGLLALGAREAAALPARQAAQSLAFLGRAVAAALAR
jgi:uncharacterized protein YigA (DUF484 family)